MRLTSKPAGPFVHECVIKQADAVAIAGHQLNFDKLLIIWPQTQMHGSQDPVSFRQACVTGRVVVHCPVPPALPRDPAVDATAPFEQRVTLTLGMRSLRCLPHLFPGFVGEQLEARAPGRGAGEREPLPRASRSFSAMKPSGAVGKFDFLVPQPDQPVKALSGWCGSVPIWRRSSLK